MICVVINGPSFQEAEKQITSAITFADCVELRLDNFAHLNLESLRQLRESFTLPMIFTLRSKEQGGGCLLTEESRIEMIKQCAELKPDYFDVEDHVPANIIRALIDHYPAVKWILSHHNFEKTPTDQELIHLYKKMKQVPAHFYKIAVMAHSTLDAMRLLLFAKQQAELLVVIGLGPYGQITRILAPVFGFPLVYASLNSNQTLFDQLTAEELIEKYHCRQLNRETSIYGLIGDPVVQSVSEKTHNAWFRAQHLNAIYVKMLTRQNELSEFLRMAKELNFKGLSVTIPLKECIIPFIDQLDLLALQIGAVNTLKIDNHNIYGFNTDEEGAMTAIEKKISLLNKQVVIIGAGGAARAIAFGAIKRGAVVTIVNRDLSKAKKLSDELKCAVSALDDMDEVAKKGYDVLINCTAAPQPISSAFVLEKTLVMDINTKHKDTLFLQDAKAKNCIVIYGSEMFEYQAMGQFSIWFENCYEQFI